MCPLDQFYWNDFISKLIILSLIVYDLAIKSTFTGNTFCKWGKQTICIFYSQMYLDIYNVFDQDKTIKTESAMFLTYSPFVGTPLNRTHLISTVETNTAFSLFYWTYAKVFLYFFNCLFVCDTANNYWSHNFCRRIGNNTQECSKHGLNKIILLYDCIALPDLFGWADSWL